MPNICGFGLRVYGSEEESQQVADWVNSLCTEDGYIDEPGNRPLRSWACLYGKCELDPDEPGLLIQGEAKGNPALFLAEMVANRFPELRVEIGGSTEDGIAELWELWKGEARLLEFSTYFVFGSFGVGDYEVEGGFRLSNEDRVDCIYEQLEEYAAESEDHGAFAAQRSAEEWKTYIRQELHDHLPTFFDDEFIRELPRKEICDAEPIGSN
jgi:hypothetical protein